MAVTWNQVWIKCKFDLTVFELAVFNLYCKFCMSVKNSISPYVRYVSSEYWWETMNGPAKILELCEAINIFFLWNWYRAVNVILLTLELISETDRGERYKLEKIRKISETDRGERYKLEKIRKISETDRGERYKLEKIRKIVFLC